MPLDYQLLLRSDPPIVAKYLRSVRNEQSDDEVSRDILQAIEIELLPPTILPTWLSITHAVGPLKQALQQHFSVFCRRAAIARIAKYLRTKQWQELWDTLGGTQGLLRMFADLSVQDVRLLARAIGACSRGNPTIAKETAVSELAKCLLSQHFEEAPFQNNDARPLQIHYMALLGGCSPALVALVIDKRLPGLYAKQIVYAHPVLLQNLSCASLHDDRQVPAGMFELLLLKLSASTKGRSGLSASMAFSLSILNEVTANGGKTEKLPVDPVEICRCLLRKAMKKRLERNQKQMIIQALLDLLSKHPNYISQVRMQDEIVCNVAECWSRSGDQVFLGQLLHLAGLVQPSAETSLGVFHEVLTKVSQSKRYEVLQRLVKTTLSIDIGSTRDLKSQNLKDLPWEILRLLRSEDALFLLKRMMQSRPTCDFIPMPSNPDVLRPSEPSLEYTDCDMVLAHPQTSLAETTRICQTNIAKRKIKAQKSQDQSSRAFYAETVLCYSFLSGSPSECKDALLWSKRFLKDPHTIKSLFRADVIANHYAVSLFSGLPESASQETLPLTMNELKRQVDNANEVVMQLFQTAVEATHEPSFQAHDWQAVFSVIGTVVDSRIHRTSSVYKKHSLTDDDIYNAVWQSTIRLLVDLEKCVLATGHEKLNLRGPHGFLQGLKIPLADQTSATLRFLDNLARSRDILWSEHRPTVYPAAASVPAPFPRGLPIQYLVIGLKLGPIESPERLAFLIRRAQDVVLMPAQEALLPVPEDYEDRVAIGSFIDEYALALAFHVMLRYTAEHRRRSIERAWSYLVDLLCGSNFMTMNEVASQYAELFSGVVPDFTPTHARDETFPTSLRLPAHTEAGEWSPQANDSSLRPARRLAKSNSICCTLDKHLQLQSHNDGDLLATDITINADVAPTLSVWHHQRLTENAPAEVQDGLVLSALLYLDSKKVAGPRQFTAPFPAAERVRFPALYLDDGFLDRRDLDESDALHVLGTLSRRAPSTLLASLTRTRLASVSTLGLKSPQAAVSERITFKMLKLLGTSDRPQLAGDMIIRTILDRPDASSWHRQLLTPKFMNSLRAGNARDLITSFVLGVEYRVDAQIQAKRSTETGSKLHGSEKPSYIKVSSIKFLAQLLKAAGFISIEFTLQSLATLLHKAPYIDARKAIVDDLLSVLAGCDGDVSSPIAKKVLATLESTKPIIAGLGERETLTIREWEELDSKLTVPQIVDNDLHEHRPILAALLDAAVGEAYKRHIVSRVVIPAASESANNFRRWLRIVCKKHDAPSRLADDLSMPFTPAVLGKMLNQYSELLPASIFESHHHWVMTNIMPPSAVAEMNTHFRSNADLLSSVEGRRWLQLFDVGPSNAPFMYYSIPQSFRGEFKPSSHPQGITRAHLELAFDAQLSGLLKRATEPSSQFAERYVRLLEPPSGNVRIEHFQAWAINAKPSIERAIVVVNSLRSPSWQQNPERQPAVLPDTFEWKTWLLPYPFISESAEGIDEVQRFAASLRALVRDMIESRKTYHHELPLIHKAAKRAMLALQPLIACCLGSLDGFDQVNSTTCLLCIGVASELFSPSAANKCSPDIQARSLAVLQQWCDSRVEKVRVLGLARVGLFED